MNTREMVRDISGDITREIVFSNGTSLTPSWSIDFLQGQASGMTFTRASAGTVFNATGALATVTNNTPRFDYNPVTLAPRGILMEEIRTNYLLNSAAPVTQTISLNAGTYTLWMVGSGNCTPAAGTAVGSGFTAANATKTVTFAITTAGTVVFTVSGAVTRFQCENGAFATSFITTTTAAATRAPDIGYFDNVSWLNKLEGTMVTEFEALPRTGSQKLITFQAGTSENDFIGFNASSSGISFSVRTATVAVANLVFGLPGDYTVAKVAGAYKQDDFASILNGGTVLTDTSGGVPTATLTHLYVGNRSGGSTQILNGWVRKIAYYPTRLGNPVLQQLTA